MKTWTLIALFSGVPLLLGIVATCVAYAMVAGGGTIDTAVVGLSSVVYKIAVILVLSGVGAALMMLWQQLNGGRIGDTSDAT